MKNNLKKKNFSNDEYLSDSINIEQNEEQRLLSRLISSLKETKDNYKNRRNRTNNSVNNYRKSNKFNKTVNYKSLIKKGLESNINLSKGYNNFCGSFLFPDYNYISASKILKDLKTKGAEKAIRNNFSPNYQRANFINNVRPSPITRNKKPIIKSKYLNLINSVRPKYNNNLFIKNNKKYFNNIKNYYNTINIHKKKKGISLNYNIQEEVSKISNNNIIQNKENKNTSNNSINLNLNNTLMNKNSFYRNSLNNKSFNSSTSCNSNNNYKKIFQLKYNI